MAKNKILVRIIQLTLVICFVGLCSCTNRMQQCRYYQYYVGTMRIDNPVLVEFEKQDDMWFVCSDSALYCCNDSDWLNRDDVFPYLPVVEFNSLFPTYFPRKELSHLAYFQWNYVPFYKCERIDNHTICRFYYDVNLFECYMQALDEEWNNLDDDIDIGVSKAKMKEAKQNNISKSISNCKGNYKIVVRQKLNIFRIMMLKKMYKDKFDDNQ